MVARRRQSAVRSLNGGVVASCEKVRCELPCWRCGAQIGYRTESADETDFEFRETPPPYSRNHNQALDDRAKICKKRANDALKRRRGFKKTLEFSNENRSASKIGRSLAALQRARKLLQILRVSLAKFRRISNLRDRSAAGSTSESEFRMPKPNSAGAYQRKSQWISKRSIRVACKPKRCKFKCKF